MTVGHDLRSCTTGIECVRVPYWCDADRHVVFVDTPGFDDTYVDDLDILELVADWLADS